VYSASTGNLITVTSVMGTFLSNQWLFSDAANLSTKVSTVASYTQFVDESYSLVRTFDQHIKFDRISYTTSVIEWQPNITVSANTVVTYQNRAYRANQTVYSKTSMALSGNITANIGDYVTQSNVTGNARVVATVTNGNLITVSNISGVYQTRGGNILINNVSTGFRPTIVNNIFDVSNYTLIDASTFDNANDRIWAYYQPTGQLPDRDLKKLVYGIEYSGVQVTGVKYTGNVDYLDSNISSYYTDANLGIRSEDIIIDGGRYYDIYNSHAPEEMVPGILFDHLTMTVSTGLASNTQTVTYRVEHNMKANAASSDARAWPQYYRVSAANTTQLTSNLNITDSNIYVANASLFAAPDLTFLRPGVIYINGEKITFWTRDTVNNRLGQIRRAVDGTGAPMVHAVGTTVAEMSTNQLFPTSANLQSNAHTGTWLNGASVTTFNLLAQETGNLIVDEASNNIVQFVPDAKAYLTMTGNITVLAGNIITQPSSNTSAVVSDNSTGSTVAVWAGNIVGIFGTTSATGSGHMLANAWIYAGGANVSSQLSSVTYIITDGTGLEGANTTQARFIKGLS
jgi:hypothetical protein